MHTNQIGANDIRKLVFTFFIACSAAFDDLRRRRIDKIAEVDFSVYGTFKTAIRQRPATAIVKAREKFEPAA